MSNEPFSWKPSRVGLPPEKPDELESEEFSPEEEEERPKNEDREDMKKIISLLQKNNELQRKQLTLLNDMSNLIRIQSQLLIQVGVAGSDPTTAHPMDIANASAYLREMFEDFQYQVRRFINNGGLELNKSPKKG